MPRKRRRKSASIADVAQKSQVSTATVSRTFAEPDKVSPDTRSRVLEAAAQVGYVPAASSSADAASAQAWQLTVLYQETSSAAFGYSAHLGRMISGVELACQELGCQLNTVILRKQHYRPEDLLALCKESDGLIPVSCAGHLDQLAKVARKKPVITINDIVRQPGISSFAPDDFGGIAASVTHLRELGHRRIVYFHINDALPPNPHLVQRHSAFEAIRMTLDTDLLDARSVVLPGRDASMVEQACHLLQAWMAEDQPPTGLICGNDSYALGFIQAAQRLGIKVPDRLSIIGIDDAEYANQLDPPLTTIRFPLEVIGSDAARHLIARLNGAPTPTASVYNYPMSLIQRASTGPAPT